MLTFSRRTILTLAILSPFARNALAARILQMATPYPDFEFHTRNIRKFIKNLSERSDGEIDVKLHSAQSLVKASEIRTAVRSRQVALGEFILSQLINENSVFELDTIPFLATSYEESRKLLAAQRPFIEETLSKQGMTLLFSVPWPPQGMYTSKVINNIGDLRGLRFRTYSKTTDEMAKLLGMVPTQTEATEMATAFLTGRVNAMITSAAAGVGNKAWEWCKYFYNLKAWLPKNVVVMNTQIFNSFDKQSQDIIMEQSKVAETRGWQMSADDLKEGIKGLEDGGLSVQTPSKELMDGLHKVGEEILENWKKQADSNALAILKKYQDSL